MGQVVGVFPCPPTCVLILNTHHLIFKWSCDIWVVIWYLRDHLIFEWSSGIWLIIWIRGLKPALYSKSTLSHCVKTRWSLQHLDWLNRINYIVWDFSLCPDMTKTEGTNCHSPVKIERTWSLHMPRIRTFSKSAAVAYNNGRGLASQGKWCRR